MPLKTDLSSYPYFENYVESKKYVKMLFQGGVSVQVRELNELQEMIQRQIQRFGDNIFKNGTILSGCNFIFNNNLNYIKINDITTEGVTINPSLYNGLHVRNSANLVAKILSSVDGFETADPDLKTLYLTYINAGSNNQSVFQAGEILSVINAKNSVFKIRINNGGIQFSNNDALVVTPTIAVEMTSGTFANGESIIQTSTGANLYAIVVDNVTLANSDLILLQLRPNLTDLANSSLSSTNWTFTANAEIRNSGNTAVGQIRHIFGSGSAGYITTTGAGAISSVTLTAAGQDYVFAPHVSVRSIDNTAGLAALDLTAQLYYDRITVANTANAVGTAYAFGITSGYIYQKGYPLLVDTQTIVVSKYNNSPSNVSVVFDVQEDIINYNIDTSLLDNNLLTENYTAPGADRLRLTPVLKVVNTSFAETSSNSTILVSFSDGLPFRQNRTSEYNVIGDEMARRTFETSGNFVIDRFDVTTKSVSNGSLEANNFSVVVDPGIGYIGGYRVETKTNTIIDTEKSTLTANNPNAFISLNYENYIKIKEVGGLFQFNSADTVTLYDTAKAFLSNVDAYSFGNTTPVGTSMGTARIRSMILDSGVAGTNSAIYKLYLFDLNLDTGKNFKDAKSVFYTGPSGNGVADIVLDAGTANIQNRNDKLLFSAQIPTIKNTSNTSYVYRTLRANVSVSNSGTGSISLTSIPDEYFPYTGTLSDSQMNELYIVPKTNLLFDTNLTGTYAAVASSNSLTGTGTDTLTSLSVGDYVQVYSNSTQSEIRRVSSIVNNTSLQLSSNVTFSNASAILYRVFPESIPVPFGSRSGLSANVDANNNILTVNFNTTFSNPSSANLIVGFNVMRIGADVGTKQAKRNIFVKLDLSNNAANTVGPWCLGVPDIFRLRSVRIGNSSVNTTSTNITNYFYIDHNQTANFYDLGYLYIDPKSNYALSNTDYLLVEFDAFETLATGYYTPVSYLSANATQIQINDSKYLANLTTAINSFEMSELYTDKGEYYDLLNCVDFRPSVVNTAALTNNYSSATINPAETRSFGNTQNIANDFKFPLPDSIFETYLDFYKEKNLTLKLNNEQEFKLIDSNFSDINQDNSITLAKLNIPAYPSVAKNPSEKVLEILDKKVVSENKLFRRINARTIQNRTTLFGNSKNQPQRKTVNDIQKIENRIKKLEYYVSLSLLETNMKNKVIPSSLDPSVSRFKYGFFVDDFSTQLFSETSSSEYAATILKNGINRDLLEDGIDDSISSGSSCLVPPIDIYNMPIEVSNQQLVYHEHELVSQNIATEPRTVVSATTTPAPYIPDPNWWTNPGDGGTTTSPTNPFTPIYAEYEPYEPGIDNPTVTNPFTPIYAEYEPYEPGINNDNPTVTTETFTPYVPPTVTITTGLTYSSTFNNGTQETVSVVVLPDALTNTDYAELNMAAYQGAGYLVEGAGRDAYLQSDYFNTVVYDRNNDPYYWMSSQAG